MPRRGNRTKCTGTTYALAGATDCSPCTNCSACSNTTGECSTCNAGYILKNKNCATECTNKQYSLGGSATSCTNCDASCSTCDNKTGKCTSCIAGNAFTCIYFCNLSG